MFKNVAGQKLTVFAFDSTTNLPKTGDAANLLAYYDADDAGVTAINDITATEIEATNAKGYYIFDLTAAETNGDKILYSAKSSTANIVVIAVPAVVYTLPASFTGLNVSTVNTLAGHDPGSTLASQTNITGGTVTTVSNVTNITGPVTVTTNLDKSGYTAAVSGNITGSVANLTNITGPVTVTTNLDKSGYTAAVSGNITGSVANLTNITGPVTVTTVLDKTGYTAAVSGNITGSVAGLSATQVAAIFTQGLTESYAANNTTLSPAQALYQIWGLLNNFAISGTSLHTYKLDGTTTAMLHTLDNATTPTQLLRTG